MRTDPTNSHAALHQVPLPERPDGIGLRRTRERTIKLARRRPEAPVVPPQANESIESPKPLDQPGNPGAPEGTASGSRGRRKGRKLPRTVTQKTPTSKNSPRSARKLKSTKSKSKMKSAGARTGSKKAMVLSLLQRPQGATLEELMKVTGWQAHSVRGFLAGTVNKKMALQLESERRQDGVRVYSIRT
jgi:hypothetical protein